MCRWKHAAIALACLAGLFGASTADAGIPVIDAANLAQSIQQVIAWVQQSTQMVTTIQNQATQIQRITGSRNLGQTFNNLSLQQAVPANVPQVMASVGTQGFGGLTTAAQTLRSAAMIYNCMDRPAGPQRASCQAPLSVNSQAQAWQSSAHGMVTQRVQEIQNMQQQINTTTDPMAINQVQAALAAETAQVANDQNRIALMKQQVDTAKASAAQALVERDMAMMVQNAPGSADNLVFP